MSICPTCSKKVYFAEKISALGKDYHKLCFKCKQCKKALEPAKFSEHDSCLYCKSCYGSVIGLKGYGFGDSLNSHISGGAAGTSGNATVSKENGITPSGNPLPAETTPVAVDNSSGPDFCASCGTKAGGERFRS